MIGEDKDGHANTDLFIDVSGDSSRCQKTRSRKKPPLLPIVLLAFIAASSVVVCGLVLNNSRPANSKNSSVIEEVSSPQKARSLNTSTKKSGSVVDFTKNKTDSLADKKDSLQKSLLEKTDNHNVDLDAKRNDLELKEKVMSTDIDKTPLEKETPATKKKDVENTNKPAESFDSESKNRNGSKTPSNEGETVVQLYESDRLFLPKFYKNLRAIHAREFYRLYEEKITYAFGDDCESMKHWLDKNNDFKEELFLAMDPQYDDIQAALSLFADLKNSFPDLFPAYGEMAIATAVVWDKGGRGIRDFAWQQRRGKAISPGNRVGGQANFEHLANLDKLTGLNICFLPWEFLIHIVSHHTPIEERKWALANYAHKRAGFAKCYHDVPYDAGLPKGAVPKLAGQLYTLDNIRRYGGDCAMQTDFAYRVGKCLGVPTEFVNGRSRSGSPHCWLMWVELHGVSKGNIDFELQSYGRYNNGMYYVGQLFEPHTGQRITDRQLELRLHSVGSNPQNHRHAMLLMKSFPLLQNQTGMNVNDQIIFLTKVMQLCPGNEQAWKALAAMSRDGKIDKSCSRKMTKLLNQLFITYENFPDFTWEVFDDLIAYNDSKLQKNLLYERLVKLYVQGKRPDLACLAVLKYADYLVADGQGRQAVTALGTTIMAFPDEGRYVPKMLDAIDKIYPQANINEEQLISFYRSLLPKIPQRNGKKPQPYCIDMYKRGILFFERSGHPELATPWRVALAQLQTEMPAVQKTAIPKNSR